MIRRLGLLAVAVLLSFGALPVAADWWEAHRADAGFDLAAARRAALAAVTDDPTGADAVAAAGWWRRQLDNLPDPEEILAAAGEIRDPELAFELARIGAALDGLPPAGVLATAEIAGPYGVFNTLDLERRPAPDDAGLPAPGTVFVAPWAPVRFTMSTLDGAVSPPDVLASRGVVVVLWSFRVDHGFDGYLAVEANGGYELALDGRAVGSGRMCGLEQPRVAWYRVRLEPGLHRFRADLAAPANPELRISLYDTSGAPIEAEIVDTSTTGPWAGADARPVEPPAMASHLARLEVGPSVAGRLLAASIFEQRRDARAWRKQVELAAELEPDSPWPRLAMAWYWTTAPVVDDAEAVRRRVREQLRGAQDIPLTMFLERSLAARERRDEDGDRYLEALVEGFGDDVRVIRLWIGEALERGWLREAEDGLRQLRAALPGARQTAVVEIEVLEALERWQERETLLGALAGAEPVDLRLVELLARGCAVPDAIAILRRLQERVADPDLDVELVRLLFAAGELETAAAELSALRRRWGALPVADELALALTAGDREASDRALAEALRRSPAALDLLSLSWRRGAAPFYEPYRLSVAEVEATIAGDAAGVDAVLLLDQAVERVFDDGSSLYYYHGVTRALTPVGARQAGRLQQLPNSLRLALRIHKPDGTVVVPANLGDGNGPAELDKVEPGDLVEEEYVARVAPAGATRRGHLPPYIYRFADSERAFGLSEYLLLVPPDLELLVEGNFEGLERSEWTVDGLRAIRWRAESVPPVPDERFAPPDSELLPWVSYGFGMTWQDIGDALRDRLLPILRTTPELERWAAPMLADATPVEAVTALVDGVLDEVEAGRGLLDFSAGAGASFSRRAGNRLGIVAAVLLDAGFQVDLVMARTRPFAGTHLVVPTFDAFIQPMLRLAKDGEELWLDLEEERRGVGRIDPLYQGSDGLLVPLSRPLEPVSILAELPTFPDLDLAEQIKVVAVVDPSGDARLTITLPIRGPQAERVEEQIRSVPTDRVPMVYQQMASSFVAAATDVAGRIDRVPGGIEVELAMRAPETCRPEGGGMVCRALVLTKPLAPILAALPSRRFPLVMPVPVLQINELVIDAPEGTTVSRRPRRIETRWGRVDETLESDGRRHRSVLRLELPAQTVAPEDYPEFARFCHAVDELLSRPPVIVAAPGGGS
ncbi:MAG: hypothetical protein MUC56_10725 [Thermoanaerobaculales bacterium]|jgi:hypothetical protein|nr:hypothetical protein [Thermoanaerobaculales bacterium]